MPDNFLTSYSDLISEYDTRINVVKQEIRDLMADPVGAGMTSGAFLELIKDPINSHTDVAVGYETSSELDGRNPYGRIKISKDLKTWR